MKMEFEAPLAQGRKANPRDVRQVKFALGCWGYYKPDPIFGITGEMDEGCWKALSAFQRAHMIPFTDTAGPGSVTERVMNEELAALEAEGSFFVWRTADDDKVREEHAQRAGRVFTFAPRAGRRTPRRRLQLPLLGGAADILPPYSGGRGAAGAGRIFRTCHLIRRKGHAHTRTGDAAGTTSCQRGHHIVGIGAHNGRRLLGQESLPRMDNPRRREGHFGE
ncbi:MAG TPA: hypothetical protein VFS88_08910 [Micavibrio sp.]|nr:hypothetical protein [Micavibrio sp.]